MNQIWFGLIWINPKESNAQRTKKQYKKNMFSRLVWTCLDPSSPQNMLYFLLFFVFRLIIVLWLTTPSSISTRKGLCMDSKRPILI